MSTSPSFSSPFSSSPVLISYPTNCQRVVHVSWDADVQAFTGIPEEWMGQVPQSIRRKRNSQGTYNANNVANLYSGQGREMGEQKEERVRKSTITASAIMDVARKTHVDDSYGVPCRVPLVLKPRCVGTSDFALRMPLDPNIWSGPTSAPVSLIPYLESIGINLDAKLTSMQWQAELIFALQKVQASSALKHVTFLSEDLLLLIISYLDTRSILALTSTCSSMHPLLELSYESWRRLAFEKSEFLHVVIASTASLVKSSVLCSKDLVNYDDCLGNYIALFQLERNLGLWDFMLNVQVKGERKVGKSKLVSSLGDTQRQNKHLRKKSADSPLLNHEDPVIEPIDGTFRFGLDLVIRRVIVGGVIVKLQVWDEIGSRSNFNNVHMVCVLVNLYSETGLTNALKIMNDISTEMLSPPTFVFLGAIKANQGNRLITFETAKRFANDRLVMYFEANTADPESVEKAFGRLATEMITSINSLQIRFTAPDHLNPHENKTCSVM